MRLLLYFGISIRKGLLLQFRFWDAQTSRNILYKIFSAHNVHSDNFHSIISNNKIGVVSVKIGIVKSEVYLITIHAQFCYMIFRAKPT